jgi:hypothetical protein
MVSTVSLINSCQHLRQYHNDNVHLPCLCVDNFFHLFQPLVHCLHMVQLFRCKKGQLYEYFFSFQIAQMAHLRCKQGTYILRRM